MLELLENLFNKFRDLGEFPRDLITWITAFGIVNFIYLNIDYISRIYSSIKIYFVYQRCSCWAVDLREKYGQWAVVTGATDGIGKSIAHELTRRGLSVILIGRNGEKLADTKAELESLQGGGEILTLKRDFCQSSVSSHQELVRQLEIPRRDIGILINSVGFYEAKPRKFQEFAEEYIKSVLDVNCLSSVLMTSSLIPSMLERGRGLIVNVSAEDVILPLSGIHIPAKAFINSFSRHLQFEYRNEPIEVVNLTTGPVATRVVGAETSDNRFRNIQCIFARPQTYANSVVNILTHPANRKFSGLFSHEVMRRTQIFLDKLGLFGPIMEMVFAR